MSLAALSRAHHADPARDNQHPRRRAWASRARAIHAALSMLRGTPHLRALGYALYPSDGATLALDMTAAIRAALPMLPPPLTITEDQVRRMLGEGIYDACARWCASPGAFRLLTSPRDLP